MTLEGYPYKRSDRRFSSLRSFIAKSEYQSTIWAFTQDNKIPGSKLSPTLKAGQSDAFLRWMQGLRWGRRNQWRMQHFSQWQILDFQDLDKEVDSDSDIWNNTLRIEYQNRIGKSTFVQSMAELSTTM